MDERDPLGDAIQIRKKNFVLLHGANTITVDYAKQGNDPNDELELTIEAEGYPAPVFKLVTKKAAGKFEKKVVIQSKAPANFKPVEVKE